MAKSGKNIMSGANLSRNFCKNGEAASGKTWMAGEKRGESGRAFSFRILAMGLACGLALAIPLAIASAPAQARKVAKSAKKIKIKKNARTARKGVKSGSGRARKSASSGRGKVRNGNVARKAAAARQESFKRRLNRQTVTLMSGCCASGAYTAFGADIKDMIARAVAGSAKGDGGGEEGGKIGEGLRVLPILGGGAGDNVRDILYLRGVDMAILNMDVIEYFRGKMHYGNLEKRIRYITRLFNEEVHLFAARGNGVNSLRDLEGGKVGFIGSDAAITANILLAKLNVKPALKVRTNAGDGALALKEGRLDALVRVSGKPLGGLRRMIEIYPQIRLVPIEFDPAFIGSHLPSEFSHEDYPELVAKGARIPTIATRAFLAVFDWPPHSPRYARLKRFTKLFFDGFEELSKSKNLHPKWSEVNLEATIPELKRFAPAAKWLESKKRGLEIAHRPGAGGDKMIAEFRRFMKSKGSGGEKIRRSEAEKLFGEFMRWRQSQR
jgi:TRAP-type uncharacterized transport system substrate-binding protein